VTKMTSVPGNTHLLSKRPRNRVCQRAHRNTRQPHPNPLSPVRKLSMVEESPPFCQRFPRSLRAWVDQTAHNIVTAHEVGVSQHLEQILSMPFLPSRTLLLPHFPLEFFPVSFGVRLNDERSPFQLQDHVGAERPLRPGVGWVPGEGGHPLRFARRCDKIGRKARPSSVDRWRVPAAESPALHP
jgi:hypothetical protein